MSAEQAARQYIDDLLQEAGWHVCDVANADLHAARGVAICTQVSEAGGKVEGGYWLEARDMVTRARRDSQLDVDIECSPKELDRTVGLAGFA